MVLSPRHLCAAGTEEIRRDIQASFESTAVHTHRLGQRSFSVQDGKEYASGPIRTGSKQVKALTTAEEAMVTTVAGFSGMFLEDLHLALRSKWPSLSKTTLYRYCRRHGIAARSQRTGKATQALRRRMRDRSPKPVVSVAIAPLLVDREVSYLLIAAEQAMRRVAVEMVPEVTPEALELLLLNYVAGVPRYRDGYVVLVEDGHHHVPYPFRPAGKPIKGGPSHRERLRAMVTTACQRCGVDFHIG